MPGSACTPPQRNETQIRPEDAEFASTYILVLALYAPFFILSFVVIQAFERVCIDVSDFAINFGLRLGMEVGARIVRRPS
jgi:hypothetical protein